MSSCTFLWSESYVILFVLVKWVICHLARSCEVSHISSWTLIFLLQKFTLCRGHFVKYLSKKRWARFRIIQWSLKSVMWHKMFTVIYLRLNCCASDLWFKCCNLYLVISLNGYSLSSLYFNNCENGFNLKWLHDIAHKHYFISKPIIITVAKEICLWSFFVCVDLFSLSM